MAHTYAPHIHLPHAGAWTRHLAQAAAVCLVVIVAVIVGTQVGLGGGETTQSPSPALHHPGNVSPWRSYFSDLVSVAPSTLSTMTCTGGVGIGCLLAGSR